MTKTHLVCSLVALCSCAFGQTFDAKDIGVFRKDQLPTGNRLAVVVGVGSYQHEGVPPLRLTEKDANDFADHLTKNGWQVTVMTAGHAGDRMSAPGITAQIASVCQRAQADDTVLFYYSGHGFTARDGGEFVCGADTSPHALEASGLSLAVVRRLLEQSKARKRLLLLDACRNLSTSGTESGALRLRGGGRAELRFEAFRGAEGTGQLFSTAPGNLSYEPAGWVSFDGQAIDNGLFTHFLLQALRGRGDHNRDQVVTFRECAYHVNEEMARWSERSGLIQKPFMKWDGGAGDDIPIGIVVQEQESLASNGIGLLRELERGAPPALTALPVKAGLDVRFEACPVGSKEFRAIDSTAELAEDDRFRVFVKPKVAGHLYVFLVDSTGATFSLFPQAHGDTAESDPRFASGRNPVEAGRELRIPTDDEWFVLDGNTGFEHVFLVLSARPWPALERAAGAATTSGLIERPFELRRRGIKGTGRAAGSTSHDADGDVLVVQFSFRHVVRK